MRFIVGALLAACTAFPQTPVQLLRDPTIQSAIDAAKRNEPETLNEQVRLTEIEAPTFAERERGEAVRAQFEKLGLRNVRFDRAGNVIGERPGRNPRPNLVFSAHLDTVFSKGTEVKVRREGTTLIGPGIGDDSRGLAVMLSVIRALDEGKVQTPGSITFVATVGEEGLGDLRGVKHLFHESLRNQIDKFISVDGLGISIANVGVGSYRYKVTVKGPGGHSFGSFGNANPIHALGRIMAKIAEFEVPLRPKTTFNVGRIGGGTSINSIAYEAWMEVDMRSSDSAALKALDARFHQAVRDGIAEENQRWDNNGRITGAAEIVGLRPAGQLSTSAPIVQTGLATGKALGMEPGLREGSTDSNVPMSMGIPAVTIGGGGSGSGAHTLQETFDSTESWKGTVYALLLAVSLAR